MLKPTANFKMPKEYKRWAATYVDKAARRSFLNDMVQAVLQSQIAPPRKEKRASAPNPTATTSEE